MAVQLAVAPAQSILFEDYESEGEISERYEIIDGVRVYMPAPTLGHQRYSARLNYEFQSFSRRSNSTLAFYAPCDVVINRFPLQVRQPDLLVISPKKYTDSGLTLDSDYFDVAPELVVEIISTSDTFNALSSKIRDYQKIGVTECWVVRPKDKTIEILELSGISPKRFSISSVDEAAVSLTFSDLKVETSRIFHDDSERI